MKPTGVNSDKVIDEVITKLRKNTILKMFMVPLILIIMIQALISGVPILIGSSKTMLADYSVGILGQTVTTRKVILENSMTHNWSNVSELADSINLQLEEDLREQNMAVAGVLESDHLQQELLREMLETCLYTMRKNLVTGSFIILGSPEAGSMEHRLNGVYFRDLDPYANPANNYTDVLMERGDRSFSRELNIPFDINWRSKFHFGNSGEREEDDFFYRPIRAAQEHPDINYMNLGYWSKAFSLEGSSNDDEHQMITYSVPLILDDGTVYGVAGVEISIRHLKDMLPAEIDEADYSGYLVALRSGDGSLVPIAYTGSAAAGIMVENASIHLDESAYSDLYYIRETRDSNEVMMASVQELSLYNSNTPFEEEVWLICGVQSYDALFGFGEDVVVQFAVSLLVAFVFALIAIFFLVRRLTRPIRNLSECIRSDSDRKLSEFSETNIVEIDELYEVVRQLNKTQRENEYRLTEEKERYRAILQSSTDVLFTYDYQEHTMELLNMNNTGGNLDVIRVDNFENWIQEGEMIHPDYQAIVLKLLQSSGEDIQEEIMAKISVDDPFEWVLVRGKTVYDGSGNPAKLIGSTQDIHERKEAEIREQNLGRMDRVTGLYKRQIGEQLVKERLQQNFMGCMVLLDVDDFFLLNEMYGIIVGDTILEELGRLTREYVEALNHSMEKGQWAAGIRIGGDEILLWLECVSSGQVREDMEVLRRRIAGLYVGSTLTLSVSGGISERIQGHSTDYAQLLLQAKQALAIGKKEKNNKFMTYAALTEVQRQDYPTISINEIAGVNYENKLSIVSLVFNFFDKGGNIEDILPILLTKLGRHFQAKAIVMTTVDRDFRTAYANYRWESEEGALPSETVCHFTEEEFVQLLLHVDSSYKEGILLEGLKEAEERFLMVQPTSSGVSVPMYDNENYIGSLTFVGREELPEWTESDRNDIQEIAKIIETNYNKEKHDMASRAKSDFLSRMSHEMRTPMNAIMGMTTIAQAQKDDPKRVEESLDKIRQSSQYLLNLINDVLDMSKIESGKMKLVQDSFHLRQALTDTCQMIQPQVQEKRLEFITDITLVQDWVVGDLLHLQQVFVNLLSNAVKFTPEGGRVTFTVEQSKHSEHATQVLFSVRDTGIGIGEDSRTRIFHSFEQADDNVSRQYGGTGLGLAISGHLVNMMGGVIELKSEQGKGSDFYFHIILENGEKAAEAAAAAENREDWELAGKRILLVDDNELNVEIAQTLLEMKGFLVETAFDGKEAVEKYQEKDAFYYDLILMDIRMPVMNGLEATRQIRKFEVEEGHSMDSNEDARAIPIVAMTANAFDEDMKKSIESGMNGHLSKPIDVDVMLDMIKRVIR